MTRRDVTFMLTGMEVCTKGIAGAGQTAKLRKSCRLDIKIRFIGWTELDQVKLSLITYLMSS